MESGADIPPVLVTMFNRPDHAARVIAAIAGAKPKQIFLAVDGPRPDVATDRAGVEGCRALTSMIDWECEVKTRFREENLGCRRGMIDGVSWFFDHVECGVVLEDDCLPDPAFAEFFARALSAYRDERSVLQVSGYGHERRFFNQSYFLPLSSSWGWATWRDRWRDYLENHEAIADQILADPEMCRAFDLDGTYPYSKMLRRSRNGEVSSWAVYFQAFVFRRNGMVLYPPKSLIQNIGFDGSGAHCRDRQSDEKPAASANVAHFRLPRRVRCSKWMLNRVKNRIRRRQFLSKKRNPK